MWKIKYRYLIILLLWLNLSANALAFREYDGKIELVATTPYPEQNITNYFLKFFASELEGRTAGKVKTRIYYSESLGKMKDFLTMLESGICDIAIVASPLFKEAFPIIQVVEYPLAGCDSVVITTEILYELISRGLAAKDFASHKLLWIHGNPPNMLYTNKKVTRMEDLKGLKIRGPALTVEAIKALGAVAVTMPPTEIYLAMQRKMIDGFATAGEFVISNKLFEVAKYLTWFPLGAGSHPTLMSLATWSKLPEEVRKIVDQICLQHREVLFQEVARRGENSPEGLQRVGIEIVYLHPDEAKRWQARLEPIVMRWADEMERRGLPGEEAVKVAQEVIQKLKGW